MAQISSSDTSCYFLQQGHAVGTICAIFTVIPTKFCADPKITNQFLAYVRRWDIVPQKDPLTSRNMPIPDPVTGLFLLKKGRRSNHEQMGDIVPLSQIRTFVDLVPRWEKASSHQRKFTPTNSIHLSENVWLNKYVDKELFIALSD